MLRRLNTLVIACSRLRTSLIRKVHAPGSLSALWERLRVVSKAAKMENCSDLLPLKSSSSMDNQEETTVRNDVEQERGEGRAQESCAGKRKSDEPDPGEERAPRGKRRRFGRGRQLRPGERYVPPPQKRNPTVSFDQEHFAETSYYFEDGLRKVYPYYFDFKTYCKGRWIGKTLMEVFSSEFRAEPLEYYEKAAKEGRIRLNEEPVSDLSVTLKVIQYNLTNNQCKKTWATYTIWTKAL